MTRTKQRTPVCLLLATIFLICLFFPATAKAQDPFDVPYLGQGYTKQQILNKWAVLRPVAGSGTAFATNPVADAVAQNYVPGALTPLTMSNGLNTWNFARWLADEGIVSISLNPDSVIGTWNMLAK